MTFLLLTVLYKTEPSKSETLRSLIPSLSGSNKCKLLVWDNSPTSASDAELMWIAQTFPGAEYRSTPGNWPLSNIYNAVIDDRIRGDAPQAEYMALLDQDSVLPPDFLVKAEEAGRQNRDVGLFLPLVWANGVLVSPASLYYFVGRLWRRPKVGRIPARFQTAINSGMVIRAAYLRETFRGYDPRLQFYGTDSHFMDVYAATEPYLVVFDCNIRHDLARDRQEPMSVRLWRHRQIVRAITCMNDRSAWRRVLSRLYCFCISLRRTLFSREMGYLKW